MHPLNGLRVVELTAGTAGQLCGKLLADAGAHVTRIAPSLWELGELAGENHLSSDWATFLDLGKQVPAPESDIPSRPSAIHALLADAELFLTSVGHDLAAGHELDCASVLVRYDGIQAACVTPFGQSGPYSGFAADDLVISALCGLADATPGIPDHCDHADEPPVQSLAPLAEAAGGLAAACAVHAAIIARSHGRAAPRHIEVASLEAAAAMMIFEWGTTAYGGGAQGRRPLHDVPEPNVYLPCKDGHVVIVAFRDDHWRTLVDVIGNPAWASDERFVDMASHQRNRNPLHERLRAWAATQKGRDILEAAQAGGLPCCPSLELHETIASDHVRQISSLREVDDAVFPADPIVVNGRRRRLTDAWEPCAGALNTSRAGDDASVQGVGPLAGVRVLDLSHIVAGPFCGQLLAQLGADVVLVESATYLVSRSFGPFVGEPWYDASMMFNHVNRGKRSVQIDLTTDGGQELLGGLATSADVVLENFSRDAAERLGITYDRLRGGREDLIMASISGFGRAGPWGDYVALHSGVIMLSGLASVTRDEADVPRIVGAIYPDLLTAAYTATAIQQAILERERTGLGAHVEVSMLDVVLTCMGGLVPSAARGEAFGRHPGRFVPTMEEGGFLALAGASSVGDEDGVQKSTRADAMRALQARQTQAGSVLNMEEVMSDPHLGARGFIARDNHPIAGSRPVPGTPWLFDGQRPSLPHAPRLGEGTDEVLSELLDLTPLELDALREDQTIA